MQLDAYLEAVLFYRAAPQKKTALAKQLNVDADALAAGLTALHARLADGALRLVETDTEVQLMTAPELSPFIETLRKEELRGDIGKAGAETLAIVLYRGPISRAEIDSIRGVNSSYILRTLMVRGLIERQPGGGGGSYRFAATPQLLAHLGVSRKEELPDYARTLDQLEAFAAAQAEEQAK